MKMSHSVKCHHLNWNSLRFLPSFESFLFGFLWNHFIFNSISNYFHLKLCFLVSVIMSYASQKDVKRPIGRRGQFYIFLRRVGLEPWNLEDQFRKFNFSQSDSKIGIWFRTMKFYVINHWIHSMGILFSNIIYCITSSKKKSSINKNEKIMWR